MIGLLTAIYGLGWVPTIVWIGVVPGEGDVVVGEAVDEQRPEQATPSRCSFTSAGHGGSRGHLGVELPG